MSNTLRRIGLTLLLVSFHAAAARAQNQDQTAAIDPNTQTIPAQTGMALEPMPATEQFVPPAVDSQWFHGGLLLLRPDATVRDDRIRLKNICRWAPADATFFAPVADLTIARFSGARLFARVTLDDVRNTLRDAGMNLAQVRLGGATACAVNRPDAEIAERQNLDDWITSRQAVPAAATESPKAALAPPPPSEPSASLGRSLRNILAADLAGRLQVDAANLEFTFNTTDDQLLNLIEPYFQFQVTSRRANSLGQVSWDVQVVSGGERHKATISAVARLWQNRAVLTNPIAYRQLIRDQDVEEKRVLIENLTDEPLIAKAQAVGQSAARELKPGMILTASMVDPVLLARPGQLITVNVIRGTIKITAVAKAIEGGSYGQTIRARNDIDPSQTFEVMLTGPQQGTVTSSPAQDKNGSPIAAVAN